MTTSTRSPGGKDRRAAGAWGILESGQPLLEEAGPPQGDGVATTAKLGGDSTIGGLIVLGQTEDDAGAEGQGLWGGRRSGEGLELTAEIRGQTDNGSVRDGHGSILAEVGAIRGSPQYDRCRPGFQTNCPRTYEMDI